MIAEHIHQALDFARILVLSLGTFNVGLAMALLWGYLRISHDSGPYRYRVLAETASYVLLTAALCTEIGLRVVRDQPIISYRLAFAVIAFPLGTYAMARLLTTARQHGVSWGMLRAHDSAVEAEQVSEAAHDAAVETVTQIDTAITRMEDEGREQ